MNTSSTLAQIAWLTSGLSPTGQTTAFDLQTVREALAHAIAQHGANGAQAAAGLPAAPTPAPSPVELTAIADAVAQVQANPLVGASPLVLRRSLPASPIGNPAFTPAATNGMKAHVIGPFADLLGALHWFDIVPPVAQTLVSRNSVAVMSLPLALANGPTPTSLTVAAGSLWINAQLLVPTAPASSFVGLAIDGGTLTLSAAGTATTGAVSVGQTVTLTLTVQPAATNGPTGGTGVGADGGAVVAELPNEVTFVFTETSAQVTAAGDANFTAYGTTTPLQWQAGSCTYEAGLSQLLIPYLPSVASFTVGSSLSTMFSLAGSAPTAEAAWALPVAVTTPAQLGAASGCGFLILLLGTGLKAQWDGMNGATALSAVALQGAAGVLAVLGATTGPRGACGTFKLWANAPSPSTASSTIDFALPNSTLVYFTSIDSYDSVTQTEMVLCGGELSAHIDRPVAADGSRLGPDMPGLLILYATASRNGVILLGEPAPDSLQTPIALALKNALMVTTPPGLLLVAGTFGATSAEITAGGLLLAFGLETLFPILPDPYAANFLPLGRAGDAASSMLLARVLWTATTHAVLSFSDASLSLASFRVTGLEPSPAPVISGDAAEQDAAWLNALDRQFNAAVGGGDPQLFMLDVSSNVDQLGVAVSVVGSYRDNDPTTLATAAGTVATAEATQISIAGLDLVAPASTMRVFTTPAVQWEPLVTVQNPNVEPNPFPSPAGFLNDGGPTLIGINNVTLVPVAPAPLLDEVLLSYAHGKTGAARFTLPFGMTALATLQAQQTGHYPLPHPGLKPVRPNFAANDMLGGRQLALTAPSNVFNTLASPTLPGAAVQLRNLVDQDGNPLLDPRAPPAPGGLQLSVLGPDVDEIFNSQFAPDGVDPAVPVTRIDFSGYGASSFSAWTDPNAVPPAVVQARFNIMVGRTNHEVVQVKSILLPWWAIVVRTITIDRQDDAEISRSDSGWVAATPGLFGGPGTTHPGVVTGAYNIREIRDTSQTYSPGGGVELVGVYFDADIAMTGLVSGGSGGRVPSTGQFGYIQTAPAHTPITPAQLAKLISARGPLGGPVDCVIALAGTAQTMRVSRVEVDNAPHAGAAETHEFAATARGSVVLPQPGSWSVLARTDSVSEPTPIDPDLGVPLIQQGAAGGSPTTEPLRLAEPVDLWTPTSPSMDYCLMHATDSTRMLFPRPVIAHGTSAFSSDQIPLLADGFALMGATSICPRQDSCLTFPNNSYALQIDGAGAFTLANVPTPFAPSRADRTLSTASVGTVALEYADQHGTPAAISVAIDSSEWSVGLTGVNVRLDMGAFDGLIRSVGDFKASSTNGVALQNGQLVLGSVLEPLELLIEFLTMLGLPNPLAMSFANGGSTSSTIYKMNANLGFNLPSPLIPALTPLMQTPTWKMSVGLKVGFGNTASSAGNLFSSTSRWMFSFTINGNMQWAVFPPIFAGGLLGFGIQVYFPAGTAPQSETLSFQIGVIASIGGNIVPNVLKVEGSVSFSFMLVIGMGASTSVAIGCGLTISVTGSILNGLLALTFSATATGLVAVTNPKSVQATFDVSVDITICWFLDIAFDLTFQYTQSI